MEKQTGSKLGKEYFKAVYCHPAYLIYMQSNHVKCQAEWITSWNLDCWEKYQWHHPNGRNQRGAERRLKKKKKAGLKLNLQKTKIIASGPITSWQIDGKTMKRVTDFILLGSKITVDSVCSHEIKRRLLLGRKAMINLDSVLKSRNITLLTNVHAFKTGFSSSRVWMWELDYKKGWAPKNWCFWTAGEDS